MRRKAPSYGPETRTLAWSSAGLSKDYEPSQGPGEIQRIILAFPGDSSVAVRLSLGLIRLMDVRRNHFGNRRISRGGAVIIVQHAAQPLAAPDRSTITNMGFIRDDQSVAETLVVSLAMIMRYEFVNSFVQ